MIQYKYFVGWLALYLITMIVIIYLKYGIVFVIVGIIMNVVHGSIIATLLYYRDSTIDKFLNGDIAFNE